MDTDDTIDSVLDETGRAWRAYGVTAADRAALGTDLRLDLAAAAAEGAGPRALIGPDIGGFARRLADEAGVRRSAPEYIATVVTALTGGAVAAIVAVVLLRVTALMLVRFTELTVDVPVQVAVLAYYGPPAAIVLTGAILAVRLHLRHLDRIGATTRRMIVLLPLAAIVVTPITMGFAWTTGYSLSPLVVVIEVALVLGALGGATALGRYLAVREPRQRQAQPVV